MKIKFFFFLSLSLKTFNFIQLDFRLKLGCGRWNFEMGSNNIILSPFFFFLELKYYIESYV